MVDILVRGIGVIGWNLTFHLLKLKSILKINKIFIEPYQPEITEIPQLKYLVNLGAKLVGESKFLSEYFENFQPLDEIINSCKILCDCSPPTIADNRILEYSSPRFQSVQGFIAQGSEHKFGEQYHFLISQKYNQLDRFLHISTCNTHAIIGILDLIIENDFSELKYLIDSMDLVMIRRDSDVAKNFNHLPAPIISPPESSEGTHHGRFLNELLNQINVQIPITSSAITINSPYMHILRFFIHTKKSISKESIFNKIQNSILLSKTHHLSTNSVYALSRDRGMNGRIYSSAIIPIPTLEIQSNLLRGFVFCPSDSNVIISTIFGIIEFMENRDQIKNQILSYFKTLHLKEI